MFSEAFLSTVMYEKVMDINSRQDKEVYKRSSLRHSRKSAHRAEESHSYRMKCAGGGVCGEEGSGSMTSQAMNIPCRDPPIGASVDLYTSWSSRYASIYKNYPDLHIGGDHILTKKDSGCVLECEERPMLLSVDMDSGSPPNDCLEGRQEEDALPSTQDSNVLPVAPFSNSVLNGYLEKKMLELYKQCYEETVTTKSINLLVSQEQNIEQAKARETIAQYLCSTTSGGCSEFITPILHISNQDSRKRWSNLSKKLRP